MSVSDLHTHTHAHTHKHTHTLINAYTAYTHVYIPYIYTHAKERRKPVK